MLAATLSYDTLRSAALPSVSDQTIRDYLRFHRGAGVVCALAAVALAALVVRTRTGDARFRRATMGLGLAIVVLVILFVFLIFGSRRKTGTSEKMEAKADEKPMPAAIDTQVAPKTEERTMRLLGNRHGAKPRSMLSPRAFSSGKRSVSQPVSRRTSEVLPWSTCPAVPTSAGANSGL